MIESSNYTDYVRQQVPAAKESLIFKFIKNCSMVEVRMREDSVNSTTNGTKFCYRRFLDTDSEIRVCQKFI